MQNHHSHLLNSERRTLSLPHSLLLLPKGKQLLQTVADRLHRMPHDLPQECTGPVRAFMATVDCSAVTTGASAGSLPPGHGHSCRRSQSSLAHQVAAGINTAHSSTAETSHGIYHQQVSDITGRIMAGIYHQQVSDTAASWPAFCRKGHGLNSAYACRCRLMAWLD